MAHKTFNHRETQTDFLLSGLRQPVSPRILGRASHSIWLRGILLSCQAENWHKPLKFILMFHFMITVSFFTPSAHRGLQKKKKMIRSNKSEAAASCFFFPESGLYLKRNEGLYVVILPHSCTHTTMSVQLLKTRNGCCFLIGEWLQRCTQFHCG